MTDDISKKDLLRRIAELEAEAARRTRHEKINQALFAISNAANTTAGLDELYAAIHTSLGTIIDTANFFIALYDKAGDRVSFPYCLDEIDGQLPDVEGVSKTASLTARVIRTGEALLVDREQTLAFRRDSGLAVPACSPSAIWLGVPLQIRGKTVGVMAVQSYTREGLYDETDKEVMVSVADQVALAIDRKRSEEEVKKLRGILPICANCKKIRDDKGYWNKLETYIQAHSDALFSHGLCPGCIEDMYGDEEWYSPENYSEK